MTATADRDYKAIKNQSAMNMQDFDVGYTSGTGSTTYSKSGGSAAFSNAALGNQPASTSVLCTTAATLNDVEGIYDTNLTILVSANSPAMYFESYGLVTSQSGTNSGEHHGIASSHTAYLPSAANTADPAASGSYALIYHLGSGSYWKCATCSGGVQAISTSQQPYVDGVPHRFEINFTYGDAEHAKVSFKVDNVILTDATTGLQISHDGSTPSSDGVNGDSVLYSAMTVMGKVFDVTAGSANAQTGYIDFYDHSVFRNLLGAI